MERGKRLFNSGFSDWTPDQLPDLSGKRYLITGANSGIGFEAARMLSEAGGNIVIACRNPEKAQLAKEALEKHAKGSIDIVLLDLSSMESIRHAAEGLRKNIDHIDALINNAGIMQTPHQLTADGFEMQLGTNHLGHFLWTALLFDLVEKANGRVVTVSSVAHKFGKINFDDLMSEKSYSSTDAYCQSKLANLMFAMDLHRRLQAKHGKVKSIACHPGYSATNLQSTGPTGLLNLSYKLLNKIVAQPMQKGAIPTVLAAAGNEAKAGGYYGPQLFSEARGRVSDAIVMPKALDEQNADRLWKESEKLTGIHWII